MQEKLLDVVTNPAITMSQSLKSPFGLLTTGIWPLMDYKSGK